MSYTVALQHGHWTAASTKDRIHLLTEAFVRDFEAVARQFILEAVTAVLNVSLLNEKGRLEGEPPGQRLKRAIKAAKKGPTFDLGSFQEPVMGSDGRWMVTVQGKTYRASRRRDLNRYLRSV